MDYDLPGAAMEIQAFIDALSNWYIRRSRDHFWGTGEGGGSAGLDTLFTVLVTLTQVAAPFLPMITEEIWSGLCDGDDTMPSSVHLSTWPAAATYCDDPGLVAAMDRLRDVASTGLRLREIKVFASVSRSRRSRSPVAARRPSRRSPACSATNSTSRTFTSPRRSATSPPSSFAPTARRQDPASARTCRPCSAPPDPATGPPTMTAPSMSAATCSSPTSTNWRSVARGCGRCCAALQRRCRHARHRRAPNRRARDVVREIQNARKAEDLVVTDRIDLWIDAASDTVAAAIGTHEAYIAEQVLGTSITAGRRPRRGVGARPPSVASPCAFR